MDTQPAEAWELAVQADRRAPTEVLGAGLWTRPLWLLALAGGGWAGRAALVGPSFTWLLWNLFLAVCPWAISSWLLGRKTTPFTFAAVFIVWLILLPNAPYLLTDLAHLRERPGVPLPLDVLVFAAFALAGAGLGVVSLVSMELEVRRRLGARAAMAMVAVVLPLCGWGVFLGRFQRWNSWDIVVRPMALLAGALEALLSPWPLAFSVGFASLFAALYVAVRPSMGLGVAGRLGCFPCPARTRGSFWTRSRKSSSVRPGTSS